MAIESKNRYSDEELQEFKVIIDERIVKVKTELDFTEQQIAELNENGFNQQGGDWNDDATIHADLEFLQRMAARQARLLKDLNNALLRIQNKTYGVCTVTGELIDKGRLRLVPHATKSVDGKNIANSSVPRPADQTSKDPFSGLEDDKKGPAKAIGNKVRIPGANVPKKSGEDWEPDNETLENAGFEKDPNDEDE
jgi:RNA polymerase-binding protein DksA